jgi:hypothetical protein
VKKAATAIVILSEAKNLGLALATALTSLSEMFRFAQHDRIRGAASTL